ncbi:MAG TPA: APC family permease [Pyrinomonadaceae bacterium]|nr:APC family permease [Pyrinomonadaceae bacterium]
MLTEETTIVIRPIAQRGHLLRILGVAFGLAVIIGGVIGMGILRTPGEVAARLPDTRLFLAAWLLGGLYALLGTISVAELGTMLPRSGGFYIFARRALGEYPGFVIGWSDWLSTCGTVAAIALVIGEYAGALVPRLMGRDVAVALVSVAAFTLLQWRGVRYSARAQELTSLVKALAFAALIAACFIIGGKQTDAPHTTLAVPHGRALLPALVLALQGIIYTYDGWYNTIYFGEEVRDSARNIPRAMFGGLLLVLAIYLLLNVALVYVLPMSQLAGAKLAVGTAAEAIFGARGGLIISALATISMLAALNSNVLTAPRILFAMSRDELGWQRAAEVNKGGTPDIALFVSTSVAALLIIFSGTFERVLAALAFFFVLNYSVAFLSVFIFRRREPDAPRPYRAWGYPWTTGAALLGSIAFLVGAILSDTENSVYALVLLAVSYPAFVLLKLRSRTDDER